MGERIGRVAGLLAAGALLAGCAAAQDAPAPDRLVLGLVPAAEVDRVAVAADGLAALLSAELGLPVETTVSGDDAALVAAMRIGRADVGLFDPIALVRAVDEDGLVPVLQTVRGGTASMHTQWMTNDPARFCTTPVVEVEAVEVEDAEVEDGEEREDRVLTYCNGTDTAVTGPVGEDALARIADGDPVLFVGERSVPGHYAPVTQIQELTGLDPLTGLDAQFVGDDAASVRAVAAGEVPVGVSTDDARTLVEDADVGARATVFAWSAELPHDGVAVRGGLPAEFRQRVADAMTAVVDTPEGAAAFAAVYGIEGLVPLDPAALDVARRVEENIE